MKTILTVPALLALVAAPALAEPQTKTVTIDRPNYEGSRTVTRDPEAGTLQRDAEVTRKSDGATAERHFERTRTDDGFTASGSATGFNGKTRSFEIDRTRTDSGSTTNGSYTTRGGETYVVTGNRARTETGFTANQHVANGAGEAVYNRDVTVARANGQVSRSVDVTRAEGFRRPPRLARPGNGRRH